jgi:hypothetical protein
VSERQLEKAFAEPKADPVADHPDAAVASESNRVHTHICRYAQAAVKRFRETSTQEAFRAYVLEEAERVCFDPAAAIRKADYVAPWTWNVFKGRVPGVVLTGEELKAAHHKGSVAAGRKRSLRAQHAVQDAYAELYQKLGRRPLQCEVANRAGVSDRTAWRYWPGPFFGEVCKQVIAPHCAVVKKVSSISDTIISYPSFSHPEGVPPVFEVEVPVTVESKSSHLEQASMRLSPKYVPEEVYPDEGEGPADDEFEGDRWFEAIPVRAGGIGVPVLVEEEEWT